MHACIRTYVIIEGVVLKFCVWLCIIRSVRTRISGISVVLS